LGEDKGRKEFAWKGAFWALLFFAFPLFGKLLDVYCTLKLVGGEVIGIPLLLTSLLVSAAAGRALRARGHSGERPFLTPPDVLVKDGIFSCMRHPNQFSMSLIPLSVALIANSPCGLLLSGWAAALGLAFILRVEEPLVHKTFCPEYCDYASSVPAISLNPKCLKEAVRELRSSRRRRKV